MSESMGNPGSTQPTDPDAWKHRFFPALVRDGLGDDFLERESSESDPTNYIVEIFPKPDPNHLDKSRIYRNIMEGSAVSGVIDLRLNNEGKYTIWLGTDHMDLMFRAAQFIDDVKVNQYRIGIKVMAEKGGRNTRVIRDHVGQSCNRTPEHIQKILDAVDVALENISF